MGFVSSIKTAASLLPSVPKPERKASFNEKLIWTALALVIYLVMSSIPLYGSVGTQNQAPLLRVIFASSSGSLMELGIGPIVTAGLVLQLLSGSELLKLDLTDPEGRRTFSAATKVLTFIVIGIESGVYIVAGILGNLGFFAGLVVFIELFVASTVVFLLDDMIQKGWGIGSGISLFILAGVAQTVMWYTFSPVGVRVQQGGSAIFGFLPALMSAIANGNAFSVASRGSLNFPDAVTFIFTVVTILFIIYIEGIKIEIPIASTQYRGFQSTYPIKLMYVSNIPVILVGAISANLLYFTNLLQKVSPAPWLGIFDGNGNPIGGLVYYITSPNGLTQTLADPLRAVAFASFMIFFSVFFAHSWVSVGGLGPREVAKQLIGARVQVPGFRSAPIAMEQILRRYIPAVTFIGGLILGVLAASTSLIGVFGTGIGLLLFVDITLQFYQALMKEQLSPAIAAAIGEEV